MGSESAPATIQRTGKRYKGLELLGVLIICASVVSCAIAVNGPTGAADPAGGVFSGVGLLVGFVLYIAGRFGGWWHHG